MMNYFNIFTIPLDVPSTVPVTVLQAEITIKRQKKTNFLNLFIHITILWKIPKYFIYT